MYLALITGRMHLIAFDSPKKSVTLRKSRCSSDAIEPSQNGM